MITIEKYNTWQLVKLPEGKHAIGVKWVFRTKFCADILTKALALSTFENLRMKLGVTNFVSRGSVEY